MSIDRLCQDYSVGLRATTPKAGGPGQTRRRLLFRFWRGDNTYAAPKYLGIRQIDGTSVGVGAQAGKCFILGLAEPAVNEAGGGKCFARQE